MTRRELLSAAGIGALVLAIQPRSGAAATGFAITHTDAEWRQLLTPDQYAVLRQKATERPFTSDLLHETRAGLFACAGCNSNLFSSDAKFDSGTGWPSFWQPVATPAIDAETDTSLGMSRTEVLCAHCGGHLGHVFDDGPEPTGLRYCINGVALTFQPAA